MSRYVMTQWVKRTALTNPDMSYHTRALLNGAVGVGVSPLKIPPYML